MIEKFKTYNLTIVVNTCDSYHDVLDIFFYALKDHWSDCSYPIVINAESKIYDHPAQIHHYDSLESQDNWGERLLATLSTIESEYVMMLYDDFILNAPLSNERLKDILEILQRETSTAVAYLINTQLPLSLIDSDDILIPLKDKIDYRLNSAPAIWRKEALVDYVSPGDTPWAWEAFGTYRTWGDGRVFYSLNPKQSDIYSYNHNKGGAIYRGKWVWEVINQVAQKYPLNIDWSKRGFASDTIYERRSFMWRLRFMQTGFRMVGLKAFYFLFGHLKNKFYDQ